MKDNPERNSEDAAELVTVTGWACKHCKRWWGKDERMARYCCSASFPCECGGRHSKSWTHCEECRHKKDHERWYAKEEVIWDGQYPIGIWNDDKFFWDEDDLLDYLVEMQDEDVGNDNESCLDQLDNLWLTSCHPNNGRDFEMTEYLCDELGEDGSIDDEEINKTVNDWIMAHAPFSWGMTGERLSIESVKEKLR